MTIATRIEVPSYQPCSMPSVATPNTKEMTAATHRTLNISSSKFSTIYFNWWNVPYPRATCWAWRWDCCVRIRWLFQFTLHWNRFFLSRNRSRYYGDWSAETFLKALESSAGLDELDRLSVSDPIPVKKVADIRHRSTWTIKRYAWTLLRIYLYLVGFKNLNKNWF